LHFEPEEANGAKSLEGEDDVAFRFPPSAVGVILRDLNKVVKPTTAMANGLGERLAKYLLVTKPCVAVCVEVRDVLLARGMILGLPHCLVEQQAFVVPPLQQRRVLR